MGKMFNVLCSMLEKTGYGRWEKSDEQPPPAPSRGGQQRELCKMAKTNHFVIPAKAGI